MTIVLFSPAANLESWERYLVTHSQDILCAAVATAHDPIAGVDLYRTGTICLTPFACEHRFNLNDK